MAAEDAGLFYEAGTDNPPHLAALGWELRKTRRAHDVEDIAALDHLCRPAQRFGREYITQKRARFGQGEPTLGDILAPFACVDPLYSLSMRAAARRPPPPVPLAASDRRCTSSS